MNIVLDINKSRILRITKQPIDGHGLLDSLIRGNIVSTFSSLDDEKFDSEFVPVRRAYFAFLELNILNQVPGVHCAVSAECGSFQINFGVEGNLWPLPFPKRGQCCGGASSLALALSANNRLSSAIITIIISLAYERLFLRFRS